MKINKTIIKFPRNLPNDIEGLIFYYPNKFPPIVEYFEEVAKKFVTDPIAYKSYAYWAQEEMFAGFEEIKTDFEKGNKEDLEFLVEIEQRLCKLFCYRFWVVNYLFADGLWHEYFVDNLKNLIRKFVDITEDIEDYEQQVLSVERDLLQTDYADLYLVQALNGVKAFNLLSKDENVGKIFLEAVDNFKTLSKEELEKVWEKIGQYIIDISSKHQGTIRFFSKEPATNQEALLRVFLLPINQVQMRDSMVPIYAFLTHIVEFKKENEDLLQRYNEMKERIKYQFDLAKGKLSAEEFELFKLCYDQSRNLSMSKDTMGEVDPFLLPFWYGEIHHRIKEILAKDTKCDPKTPIGQGGMFYNLVWFLPEKLKAKVMTPDYEPYVLRGNKEEVLKNSPSWNAWEHPRE